MSTWWGDSKNMEEIEFSRWLFEGRLRQGKNVLPDGLNWLCYFAGSSKSHRENSISFIFLESPHQVDMKNIVKSSKHFFGYFNTLETHSALCTIAHMICLLKVCNRIKLGIWKRVSENHLTVHIHTFLYYVCWLRWLLFAFFLTLYFSESSNIVTKIGLGNNLDRQQLDKG